MKIIFATGNKDKIKEIRAIFGDRVEEVLTMKEAGIDIDIEENGTTFLENALIKARSVAAHCDAIVMADDSGLVIDALNGEPGVYSARYLGRDTSYHEKNQNLIERLAGKEGEERSARFVCAIAAVMPDGREFTSEKTMEGQIGFEEKGENGFGYDPIFFLPEYGKYSAELAPEEKNRISHRGKALRDMEEQLKDVL
ncbi:MAG: XTP/dITP diphosphatase [Lachnospiraceae bacterium]|nr:XTP/dITP diphosphatase [Lachnospiraceae bacterium]MBQ3793789.1 XTP/dITP diphosphatase [Lachnospiraceae bacterium]MBQ5376144.1 XTP/dITP diphosphatase [Lachnospiraceae bacterium]MBR1848976.1 XTP/dITP diphosphatase [Lachnospiraceae bacterium]